MNTFLLIILGVILGWFIPRPRFIGPIEEKILGPIKNKVPQHIKWW